MFLHCVEQGEDMEDWAFYDEEVDTYYLSKGLKFYQAGKRGSGCL